MKKISFIIIFLSGCLDLYANPGLAECYRLSEANYPLAKQFGAEQNISALLIDNYNALYLPQMKLIGQAQYQSDVTKIELDLNIQIPGFKMPEIPAPTNDQYKIGLSVNQLIWDGGAIEASKELELANTRVSQQNISTRLYGLKQQVNEAYFGILILDKNIKSLEVLNQTLGAKLDKVNATVAGGAALQLTADIIAAEILKNEQGIIKLKARKSAACRVLADLTGTVINENEELALPEPGMPENEPAPGARPEYKTFALAGGQIDKYSALADAKWMPKVSAFGQAMYGRPGLNMFESGFQAYYIVGVQASWDFWPWGTKQRDKEILSVKKDMIGISESVFTLGLKIQGRQYVG
mgnify:FL=1